MVRSAVCVFLVLYAALLGAVVLFVTSVVIFDDPGEHLCNCGGHEGRPSTHFEERGTSFFYPREWRILKSEWELPVLTVLFDAGPRSSPSENLILLSVVDMWQEEHGRNDEWLREFHQKHEAQLDSVVLAAYQERRDPPHFKNREGFSLLPGEAVGEFCIEKRDTLIRPSGIAEIYDRRYQVKSRTSNRTVFYTMKSTGDDEQNLVEGLRGIDWSIRFPSDSH